MGIYEEFASLVVRRSEPKERRCLSCGALFLSTGNGNRICCECNKRNRNAPRMASESMPRDDVPCSFRRVNKTRRKNEQ